MTTPSELAKKEFVSFIQPFKNRAYTQDTADEIERRVEFLLQESSALLLENVAIWAEGMKKRDYSDIEETDTTTAIERSSKN